MLLGVFLNQEIKTSFDYLDFSLVLLLYCLKLAEIFWFRMQHELQWHLASGGLSFPVSAQFSSETYYPERAYCASVGALTLECDRR